MPLGFFLGLPAVIMGMKATGRIRRSGGWQTGKGMAVTGQVLGWASLADTIVIVAAIVFVAIGGGAAAGPSPSLKFVWDDSHRSATVVMADPGVRWDDLAVSGCAHNTITRNTGAAAAQTDPVQAADTITGCVAGETLVVAYRASGKEYVRHKFV